MGKTEPSQGDPIEPVWLASCDLSANDRNFVIASLPTFAQKALDFDQKHVYYTVVPGLGYINGRLLFGEFEIYQVYVAPDYRRQGWASRMLVSLQDRDDIDRILLEVRGSNTAARALYQKYNFTEISVRENYYAKPREDAVIMEWRRDCE